MTQSDHKYLVIPGPVEVRREILEAQSQWMIGHRSSEFAALYGRLHSKLQQAFFTESRVFMVGCSGTGFWEGASRNCIRDDQKVLHLRGGAFSDRWASISEANGKQVDTLDVEWGEAHTPEMLKEALQNGPYDAVCMVHNETSTGVTNPVKDLAAVVHAEAPDTLVLVDSVSGFLGTELCTDEWGLDLVLTSSQKAFALPPGIAFAAVSDRVLARAEQIEYRGYYFDFLEIDKSAQKNNTPSTPPVSLMFAADQQMDDILAEGIENRWARHIAMKEMTHEWATSRGFGLYADEPYRSNTVTTVDNREKGIDVNEMSKFMAGRGFAMDKGYGKIKGPTFRIAHMGDMQIATLEEVFDGLDAFIGK
ncbi:alanine--glyoxylate aminotransferase family protein [Phototrophicus methaneseepsis]|uniref:Alanine--glyoxylate aminotransferase family protein n=1 Tax=Phototrophicus methaneseepsis TaxID=2710758 RepID=A0A7S8IEJ5_9CHLR|nr:alanine--glyoxylate aminotransferase family protein [Phototrophicus methaneseepsis]QPC82647.1 alanine--glyoxylate aminotransferase family protein [Phototrophicus methaneseepsis]